MKLDGGWCGVVVVVVVIYLFIYLPLLLNAKLRIIENNESLAHRANTIFARCRRCRRRRRRLRILLIVLLALRTLWITRVDWRKRKLVRVELRQIAQKKYQNVNTHTPHTHANTLENEKKTHRTQTQATLKSSTTLLHTYGRACVHLLLLFAFTAFTSSASAMERDERWKLVYSVFGQSVRWILN